MCIIPSIKRGKGCVKNTMKINYNPKLKELARKLRKNLKRKKMMGYDFHRQKPIDSFIVDIFCNKLKLTIELDGYTHTFEEVSDKDNVKEETLRKLGITILRFCDEDVMKNTEGVLHVIRCFIEDYKKRKLHTP